MSASSGQPSNNSEAAALRARFEAEIHDEVGELIAIDGHLVVDRHEILRRRDEKVRGVGRTTNVGGLGGSVGDCSGIGADSAAMSTGDGGGVACAT